MTTQIDVGMLRLVVMGVENPLNDQRCVLMNIVTGETCRATPDDLIQIAERILQDRDPGDPLWKKCPMVSWLASRTGKSI